MPDAIVTNNGASLFATFREIAWHKLGNVFHKEIHDYREMMVAAGVDKVEYWFAEAPLPTGATRFVTPTVHILWRNPLTGQGEVIGTVGERYNIISLDETFSLLQDLGAGKRWETMGIIEDGRKAFGSIAYDRETVLDPNGVSDVVKSFLLVSTSFDGSSGLRGGRTNVRVVCKNTLDMAMSNLADTFTIRHTKSYTDRLAQVRREMALTDEYFDRTAEIAKQMFATKVSDKEFWAIVHEEFPKPEKDVKGAMTKWDKKMEYMAQAWKGAPNAGIKNTAWGAYNDILEVNQWTRNIQKNRDNGEENFWKAGSGLDNATNEFRKRIFNRTLALVK